MNSSRCRRRRSSSSSSSGGSGCNNGHGVATSSHKKHKNSEGNDTSGVVTASDKEALISLWLLFISSRSASDKEAGFYIVDLREMSLLKDLQSRKMSKTIGGVLGNMMLLLPRVKRYTSISSGNGSSDTFDD